MYVWRLRRPTSPSRRRMNAPDEPTRDGGEEDGKERTREEEKRREKEGRGPKGETEEEGGRERKNRAERQKRGKIKAAEQLDENETRKFR